MATVTIEQALQIALQCHQSGQFPQAEHVYGQILAADPGHADALHYSGVLAHQSGRNDVALARLRQAVARRPDYAEAHNHLGVVLCAAGLVDDAIAHCRRAIALRPDVADAHYNLGNALKERGDLTGAILSFRRAVALRPQWPEAHNNLWMALNEAGRLDEALAAGQQAVAVLPESAEAHCALGNALKAKGQLDAAVSSFKRAVALNPKWPEALNYLGVALKDQGRLDEAIAVYHQALAIDPGFAEAHSNLGVALQHKGQLADAMAAYRHAISLDADLPDAHFNLATQLLLHGDFDKGWKEYEWRYRISRAAKSWDQSHPRWDGRMMPEGTVALHHEQGFGDTIQFIRYIRDVTNRVGKVVIVCPPELRNLLQGVPGVAQCVAIGETHLPADAHCPMLSLPLIFGTTTDRVPAPVPYLHADADATAKWRKQLSGDSARCKVGLVWAGRPTHENDLRRSIPLSALAPLVSVPGVSFYSLQKGPAANQALNPPSGMKLIDLTDQLNDFVDTAALIANLDLVISVDTAVVHLAGAMAKPVWTLLPMVPDWRWLLDREDCPWYPTMRLFRQSSIGDWEAVVRRVAIALGSVGK